MKYCWLVLFLFNIVFAQTLITRIDEIPTSYCAEYIPLKEGYKSFVIPMPFNSNVVKDSVLSKKINSNEIVKIVLVYTSFREAESFNQKQLNLKRWKTLQSIIPEIFYLPNCSYENIAQTEAKQVDTARSFFHGFYIYTKTKSLKVSRLKKDFDMIDASLKEVEKFVTVKDSICIEDRWVVKKRYEKTGFFLPAAPEKRQKGMKSPYQSKRYPFEEKILVRDSILKKDSINCSEVKIKNELYAKLTDSTVVKTLQRFPKWNKKLMVVDVTGSMAPYSLQVLLWIKMLQQKAGIQQVVYFNDGDNKADSKKAISNTGGIYIASGSLPFDSLQRLYKKAMINGDGGDIQENDIEALVAGIESCSDCNEVILVADNLAPVRDMNLLRKIQRPIHVILCGSLDRINPEHFRIAEETRGSIHTTYTDADFSKSFVNGDMIQVGSYIYKYYNNRFILFRSE